uniref:Uncharacterized protein n=1 Tax=Nelumbo nucifera TaxID=4432 RepID=A0A822YEP0_NELNU|nr:TPA_asm: hypothetical protein HUJ06_011485 [Nelumbo nucifera]
MTCSLTIRCLSRSCMFLVFIAVGLRDTSVVVVILDTGEVYIVASLSTRSDTQVIYIDPTTRLLCYNG